MRALFIAVLLLLTTAGEAREQKRVALLIGNAQYTQASTLSNPHNDVRLLADAARRAGFSVVDTREDLGIREFQQALRAFRELADDADVAMVYYAGHGMEGNGKNWLIPADARLISDRDLPFEAIDLDLVLQAVQGAKLRMIVLDACRNNPFGRTWRSGTRAVGRGLANLEVDDVLILYSAAPGQVAADGEGDNSPFAAALARRLVEPDLPVQMLGGMVRDDVLSATDGAQRPFVSASITGTAFYLVEAPESSRPLVAAIAHRSMDAGKMNAQAGGMCGSQCDKPPLFLSGDAPIFPKRLADLGRRWGQAEAAFTVGTDGYITNIKLSAVTGADISQEVFRAISTWRYSPASKNGASVAMDLMMYFVLTPEDAPRD